MDVINTKLIIDFVDELQELKNFDDCFKTFSRYVEKLGFDGVVYSYISLALRNKAIIKYSENYTQEHLEYYQIESNTNNTDRVSLNDYIDIIFHYGKDVELKDEHLLTIPTSDRDITTHNNICFRASLSQNTRVDVSVLSKKNYVFFRQTCIPNIATLKIMTHLFYSKMESSNYNHKIFIIPLIPKLNNTKTNVLKGLARGLRAKQIADELNLTEKYIQNLTGAIRNDFDCKTNEQLMYIAGIIQLENSAHNTIKN